MRKKRSIRAEFFVLCCSIIAVIFGAMPLFEKHNIAQVLILFFGAFGAGASLTNLVRNLREKDKE